MKTFLRRVAVLVTATFALHAEEVSFTNKDDGIVLSGTLSLPKEGENLPAVVLIAGTGPLDRNSSIAGHKPFLVLAQHLTSQGFAVLRYDKRGVPSSEGDFRSATLSNFASDAQAGLSFLRSHERINPNHVGLIGHSEGGLVATMVAANSKDVAFLVTLGGLGLSGEEILNLQEDLLLKAKGTSEALLQKEKQLRRQLFALIKDLNGDPELATKLQSILTAYSAGLPNKAQKAFEERIPRLVRKASSPWFMEFLTIEPASYLKRVQAPTLVLAAEKDRQVPPSHNLPPIEKALKEGQNPDFTIEILPNLNHLFQTCQTGNIEEYSQIEETLAQDALQKISRWIKEHTR